MTFGIHKSAEKVLEAVVDFSVRCKQRDPVAHGMTLCVFQVVNALDLLHTSYKYSSRRKTEVLQFVEHNE